MKRHNQHVKFGLQTQAHRDLPPSLGALSADHTQMFMGFSTNETNMEGAGAGSGVGGEPGGEEGRGVSEALGQCVKQSSQESRPRHGQLESIDRSQERRGEKGREEERKIE